MSDPVRRLMRTGRWDAELVREREWLVTNGLGGYAAGTVTGPPTRRYHGVLIAALAAPLGRTMTICHLTEQIRLPDDARVRICFLDRHGQPLGMESLEPLEEFRLEAGMPVWTYRIPGGLLEKRLVMLHLQNTVHVSYRLVQGKETVRLSIMPWIHFRSHDAAVSAPMPRGIPVHSSQGRIEVVPGDHWPLLRMKSGGERSALVVEEHRLEDIFYATESGRGYDSVGTVWAPGYFRVFLSPGQEASFVASTEDWDAIAAVGPPIAFDSDLERRRRLLLAVPGPLREGLGAELILAADQFLIQPATRAADTHRAHSVGDEIRTVIAGYHWFTDWGRDTMISLEGLTLVTGRHAEAGYILRSFAYHIRDGLIPNYFPEGKNQGVYHTADATLWFFHALDRYLAYTHDRHTLRLLLPKLEGIIAHHLKGTRFNIGVDPADGLLRQGAPGYALTWMDAKCGDLVVTPRRGKAVEINGLWYNALRLLEHWLREEGQGEKASQIASAADRTFESFNRRFWNAEKKCLFDIVDGEDGDDPACRPNQLLTISPRFPLLARDKWEPVVLTVRERLLTPLGLRSLAPGDPGYQPKYDGDLPTRDNAYHQGTVWTWLIGPFVDAWLRTYPHDEATVREWLEAYDGHLSEAGVGSISEIFDAEEPFTPRGCVAQAWSVAEVLRSWARVEQAAPHTEHKSGRPQGKLPPAEPVAMGTSR